MSLANIRVVLVRPRGAANIGATARAMKNMGLRDLALVQPGPLRWATAREWAVHAADVIDARQTMRSLQEAVRDCALVVGTTARRGLYRESAEGPRDSARRIVARAGRQRCALVFGPEDSGLSNDDLKLCHQLIAIPTAAEYASLNLAQAVLLCAYELRNAAQDGVPDDDLQLADAGRVSFLYEKLQAALLRVGFLHGDNPDHIMFALRRMFGRAGLEEQDVRILLGLSRQIDWYARGGWRIAEAREAEGRRVK